MSCMSGSSNLNSFRDRGQVAVQLVSCGVLLPGLNFKELWEWDAIEIMGISNVSFIDS